MTAGVPIASGKSEIFEIVLKFMPDWVQVTVLCLVVAAVLISWGLKLKHWIARRRGVGAGVPVPAAARPGQGRGADYLGAYAPQAQQTREPSGADFLGAYAQPQQPRREGSG